MDIREATNADIRSITSIYNDAVENTTAIWDENTVDEVDRAAWLAERQRLGYPVYIAEACSQIVGYATFGDWRARTGFRYTVENSVYVRAGHRGEGIGEALMGALIKRAQQLGKHVLVAAIDSTNVASIRLHEKLGFTHAGMLERVGVKFGSWLDLVLLQLILSPQPHLGRSACEAPRES